MTQQLHREVQLTVAKPQSLFIQAPNAVVIKDMRVRFSIEKKIGKEPNSCTITITNLTEDTRAMFETTPLHVRLDAGYNGELERLFAGDLISGRSRQVDTDWETELQISDGARAYANARVNRSFKAGVTLRQCLSEVANSLGLKLPKLSGQEFDRQFATGVVLYGLAQREMTRLLKPYGFLWSIQDGRLQILRKTEARKETALIISQDSGMVGSPDFGTPEKKGKPAPLLVKSKLKPAATPGGLIQVKSDSINGNYRLNVVKHEGDNYGGAWDTDMEAAQL